MEALELFSDLAEMRQRGSVGVSCDKPTLMIAMTPRTGSSHLCAALAAASGGTGFVYEVLNSRGVIQLLKSRNNVHSFADYARLFGAWPGDVFILKTCWRDFVPFAPLYRELFPRLSIVYLDRLDLVAQSVSLCRARQTNEWARHAGQAPSRDGSRDQFDPEGLKIAKKLIQEDQAGWRSFFAAEKIRPLRLSYEGFVDDVMLAVDYIAQHFGLPFNRPVGPEVGFAKLADEVSADWVERARAFL